MRMWGTIDLLLSSVSIDMRMLIDTLHVTKIEREEFTDYYMAAIFASFLTIRIAVKLLKFFHLLPNISSEYLNILTNHKFDKNLKN